MSASALPARPDPWADPVLSAFAVEVGESGPIAVEGGRTRWEVGGPPAAGTRLVRAPAGIVDITPAEMVARVRAGTPVAELEHALAEVGQRSALPLRGGTVGGAFAVAENHLEVLGRGTVRASLLQVRYVSAEGRLVTGGGPTVKNVSGYDLPRLMAGSLGTLGLFAEVVVRTNPVPEASVWSCASDVDPFAVRGALYRPSAVLWDGATTWVLLEGAAADVRAGAVTLGALGAFAEVGAPPELPPYRWSLRPAELRTLDRDPAGAFVASVGVGLVHAGRPAPGAAVDPVVAGLHDRLKQNFDPAGRLNPGRDPLRRSVAGVER